MKRIIIMAMSCIFLSGCLIGPGYVALGVGSVLGRKEYYPSGELKSYSRLTQRGTIEKEYYKSGQLRMHKDPGDPVIRYYYKSGKLQKEQTYDSD